MPGKPERRSHDYVRSGVTSVFAAFDIVDETVISALHRRHRAVEFKKFLVAIDQTVSTELDIHLICDNLATHKTVAVRDWLANIHGSISISRRPDRRGSTRLSVGSGISPTNSYAVESIKVLRHCAAPRTAPLSTPHMSAVSQRRAVALAGDPTPPTSGIGETVIKQS
ncbi:hypothetical protein [Rhodococcus sp. WS3]|uniref:hypothetical protein n=1 Tax=Rhodococcus sp. WS3 TaxID=2486271 RepID=UPI0005E2610C|nr:hypothetical protein SZ00_06149 [Rhodococcus sp. AD45]